MVDLTMVVVGRILTVKSVYGETKHTLNRTLRVAHILRQHEGPVRTRGLARREEYRLLNEYLQLLKTELALKGLI